MDFFTEAFVDGRGGRREWELRLCCCGCCSSTTVGSRGLAEDGNISGVCLLFSDEERTEPLILDIVGVPRNVIFGDGTLL